MWSFVKTSFKRREIWFLQQHFIHQILCGDVRKSEGLKTKLKQNHKSLTVSLNPELETPFGPQITERLSVRRLCTRLHDGEWFAQVESKRWWRMWRMLTTLQLLYRLFFLLVHPSCTWPRSSDVSFQVKRRTNLLQSQQPCLSQQHLNPPQLQLLNPPPPWLLPRCLPPPPPLPPPRHLHHHPLPPRLELQSIKSEMQVIHSKPTSSLSICTQILLLLSQWIHGRWRIVYLQ